MEKQAREFFYRELQTLFDAQAMRFQASMRDFTTLRLGGVADVLAEASSPDMVASALVLAHKHMVPVALIGNGSNLLIRDGGFRGLVLRVANGMNRISPPVPLRDGRFLIEAEAGVALNRLSHFTAEQELTGMEFAAGIPGTVGGAIYMNAGAYGREMKDVVCSVTACTAEGKRICWTGEDMDFGYRKSRLSRSGEGIAITSVTIVLSKGERTAIHTSMKEFLASRRDKQPLSVPSCGSTFQRPEGHFAGALIEQCGLKGLRIGGASVSTLHAGFLVNDGEGTASDYLALMAQVQRCVMERTGVWLSPEVRIIGEDASCPEESGE